MSSGRLVAVNGVAITADTYAEDNARRPFYHEFNLSTISVPPQNTIIAGSWYDDSKPEASIAEGPAKTLKLKLCDKLQFDLAGQTVTAPSTSVRKLEWCSMRVNFLVVINPRVSAAHLDHRFPSVRQRVSSQ